MKNLNNNNKNQSENNNFTNNKHTFVFFQFCYHKIKIKVTKNNKINHFINNPIHNKIKTLSHWNRINKLLTIYIHSKTINIL